jgi:hypothetical protein
MRFAAEVYVTADKYNVPKLRDLALKKFDAACTPGQSEKEIADFIDTIAFVHEATSPDDMSLCRIVLRVAKLHIHLLLESEMFKSYLLENQELNFSLLSMLGLKDEAAEDAKDGLTPRPLGSHPPRAPRAMDPRVVFPTGPRRLG